MQEAVTGVDISTTVEMKMIFLSMPFAQKGINGKIPPGTLELTVVDHRGVLICARLAAIAGGYIVVETTCSFLLFVLLIFSILSIINIVTIQARVHYALTQTAETLSLYSYVLERTGLAEHMLNSAAKAEDMQGELDQMKASINGVIDGLEQLEPSQVGTHGKAAVEQGKTWVQKTTTGPKAVLQDVLNYALKNAEGLHWRCSPGRSWITILQTEVIVVIHIYECSAYPAV